MTESIEDDCKLIFSPLTLPCGRRVKNRLAKAAMYESLTRFPGGPPTPEILCLYELWARGGWGIILTGNVQISTRHRGLGRDLLLNARGPSEEERVLYTKLANATRSVKDGEEPPLALMQLNHAGRQSPNFLGGRWPWDGPFAPSPRRVGEGSSEGRVARAIYRILFQTPRAMTLNDVEEVKREFVQAAVFAHECGFDGVQVHAAHGYLLAQFLSPMTNHRTDKYKHGVLLVKEICESIRAAVPSTFVVGLKLNAADYTSGGLTEEQALEHVKVLSTCNLDFIEVSGGSYDSPAFTAKASPRQAFFSNFSKQARAALSWLPESKRPLIMLTGALRTASDIARCLRAPHADIAGLARPAAVDPWYPRHLDNPPQAAPDFYSPAWYPRLLNASMGTAWHCKAMLARVRGDPVDFEATGLGVLCHMFLGPSWKTMLISCAAVMVASLGVAVKLLASVAGRPYLRLLSLSP